jgi:hypothetical protein
LTSAELSDRKVARTRRVDPSAKRVDNSEIHTAHAATTVVMTATGRRRILLRRLGNHRLGRDHEPGDRRGILQRGTRDLGRVEDTELDRVANSPFAATSRRRSAATCQLNGIFKALHQRIQRENQELYPLAEKI